MDYGKKPHNACSPNVNNITYVPHLKTHLGEMHLFRTLLRRPTTIIRYPINHGKEKPSSNKSLVNTCPAIG